MDPVISVIVPVYNVERFLQPCIDSLLAQSFQEIEFIFVNDASPDNSLKILLENERRHSDVMHVIDSRENLCQGGARNLGLEVARGAYIGFVDPDDLVAPSMYEILYEAIDAEGSDAAFVQYATFPEDGSLADILSLAEDEVKPLIRWDKKLLEASGISLTDDMRMDLMCYPIGGVVCGLWKKDIILDNNVFFPEHMKYEDNYWAALLKCYISKVSYVPHVLYYYRENSNSTTHQSNASHHFDRIEIENLLLTEVRHRGFFDRYRPAWEYIYTFRYVFNSYYLFLTQFDESPLKQMKKLMDDLDTLFPDWNHNQYYLEQTSKWRRFSNALFFHFPEKVAKLYPLYRRLRYGRSD